MRYIKMGKGRRIRNEKLRNDTSIEWKTVVNRFGYIVSKRVKKEDVNKI